MNQAHSLPRRLIVSHACRNLFRSEAQFFSDHSGHGRAVNHVPSRRRDGQAVGLLGSAHSAVHPVEASVFHFRHAHVAVLAFAAAIHRNLWVHSIQQRIVSIQYSKPVRAEIIKNFALGLQNPLAAPQVFNVSIPHIADHCNIRAHHFTQIPDLTKMIHPRFNHGRAVLR